MGTIIQGAIVSLPILYKRYTRFTPAVCQFAVMYKSLILVNKQVEAYMNSLMFYSGY